MSHPPLDRFNAILIIGPPGSGKGTQGSTLGTLPRFFHCSCGEIFRTLDTRTPIGRAFLEYSCRGQLVPDQLTVELWRERIKGFVDAKLFKPDIDHIILDGIPRNLQQAQLLEPFLNIRRVFHLHCPDRDELIRRIRKRAIKNNRLDDAAEDVILHRLATYDSETKPLLDFYGPDRISIINALEAPICVLAHISSELARLGIGTAHIENPRPN